MWNLLSVAYHNWTPLQGFSWLPAPQGKTMSKNCTLLVLVVYCQSKTMQSKSILFRSHLSDVSRSSHHLFPLFVCIEVASSLSSTDSFLSMWPSRQVEVVTNYTAMQCSRSIPHLSVFILCGLF